MFAREGYTIADAIELILECERSDMVGSEPDDKGRPQWMAILRLPSNRGYDLYVKVALNLPDMRTGYFLSFHPWG